MLHYLFGLPLAILSTLITRIIVGLIGIRSLFISSSMIPTTDRITMITSSWFHLKTNTTGHMVGKNKKKLSDQIHDKSLFILND